MLVLTRSEGQRLFIGDDVIITVVRIGDGNVRIGIDAPRDTNIVREEVVLKDAATILSTKPGITP